MLTPGTDTGVYQMIGESIREYIEAEGSFNMNQITLIGIASYGAIYGRERLENKNVISISSRY